MTRISNYLFTSDRLGFRTWNANDITSLAAINDDDKVMEFFPNKPSLEETAKFIKRMQIQHKINGYCYYAVDLLKTGICIGFIGLSEQTYLQDPKTFVDIGWRLHKDYWNRGLATEGALACLHIAFQELGLGEIYSVTPEPNKKSEYLMQKIGMKKLGTFLHPNLSDAPDLQSCVFYKITKEEFLT